MGLLPARFNPHPVTSSSIYIADVFVLHACTIWDRSVNCYVIFYAPSPDFSVVVFLTKSLFPRLLSIYFFIILSPTAPGSEDGSCTFLLWVVFPVRFSQGTELSRIHPRPGVLRLRRLKQSLFSPWDEDCDVLRGVGGLICYMNFDFSSHHLRQQPLGAHRCFNMASGMEKLPSLGWRRTR